MIKEQVELLRTAAEILDDPAILAVAKDFIKETGQSGFFCNKCYSDGLDINGLMFRFNCSCCDGGIYVPWDYLLDKDAYLLKEQQKRDEAVKKMKEEAEKKKEIDAQKTKERELSLLAELKLKYPE